MLWICASAPPLPYSWRPSASRKLYPRAVSIPMPPSVLALPPRARTILAGLRLRANRTASPKPRLEALSGSRVPPGRSPSPQVLATSTTAVTPSNAMLAWTGWPVGPATV